jgi:DNA-binding NtrC family response regulator
MRTATLKVLLVDDDPLERRLLRANIGRDQRVTVQCVASGEEALAQLSRGGWDAVMTDVVMPGMNGVELVRHIRQQDVDLPVIMFTGSAAVDGAVAGMRAGATDYLVKPINAEMVVSLLESVVREQGRAAVASRESRILGCDPRLDSVRLFAARIARVPYARVLVSGQSGTGKSLLAREIHDLSAAGGEFVAVNCAALPGNLLESELFGYEKGAFTDARTAKRGLIESAREGTLFLDEIGALPLELQAKLLLFLENHEVRRLGGVRSEAVRTRVIAATNEDLHERVRERTFRADLLYRLDVAAVAMPSLAEMPAVIPELVRRMVTELSAELGRPEPPVSDEACAALARYPWPGNVRELRNAVERALVFHDGGELEIPVPSNPGDRAASFTMPFGITLEELERRYIEAMIAAEPHLDYVQLAPMLGISRKTLWEKRRRYRL